MKRNIVSQEQVKRYIKKLEAKDVEVLFNLGRNKFVTFYGKLSGVYPAIFTVTPFDKNFKGQTSYSYAEYLCGKVKLKTIN